LGRWSIKNSNLETINIPSGDVWRPLAINGSQKVAAFSTRGSKFAAPHYFALAAFPKFDVMWTIKAGGWFPEVVSFSPDQKNVAVTMVSNTNGLRSKITVREVSTGSMIRDWPEFQGRVRTTLFTDDGKRLILACNDGLRLWDVVNGTKLRQFDNQYGFIGMAFTSDRNSILAVNGKGELFRVPLEFTTAKGTP
jgi:WD40 repeat protein